MERRIDKFFKEVNDREARTSTEWMREFEAWSKREAEKNEVSSQRKREKNKLVTDAVQAPYVEVSIVPRSVPVQHSSFHQQYMEV